MDKLYTVQYSVQCTVHCRYEYDHSLLEQEEGGTEARQLTQRACKVGRGMTADSMTADSMTVRQLTADS